MIGYLLPHFDPQDFLSFGDLYWRGGCKVKSIFGTFIYSPLASTPLALLAKVFCIRLTKVSVSRNYQSIGWSGYSIRQLLEKETGVQFIDNQVRVQCASIVLVRFSSTMDGGGERYYASLALCLAMLSIVRGWSCIITKGGLCVRTSRLRDGVALHRKCFASIIHRGSW